MMPEITCPYCHTLNVINLPDLVDENGYVADYEYNMETCCSCQQVFAFRLAYIPHIDEVYTLQAVSR